ncbi:hypothetical protein [Nocardioides sp. AN3]
MTGTSRVVAGAVVCAVVSLSGVVGGPAQADGGATPTLGGAVGAVGGAVDNLGGTAGGAVGGTGDAVSGTAGGAVHQVTGVVGGAVSGATTSAGSTAHHVVGSVGGRLPQQPHASTLTSGPTTSAGTPQHATEAQPGTVHVVRAGAAAPAVKDPAPATAGRRISPRGERARRVPVSRTAPAPARLLIRATMRPEWWNRSAVAGSTGSMEVAMPASSADESCRSASLAFADLRRCAHASMLIPQLGGPGSVWLPLSLAMVGTGVVLVGRRRRGSTRTAPVG